MKCLMVNSPSRSLECLLLAASWPCTVPLCHILLGWKSALLEVQRRGSIALGNDQARLPLGGVAAARRGGTGQLQCSDHPGTANRDQLLS